MLELGAGLGRLRGRGGCRVGRGSTGRIRRHDRRRACRFWPDHMYAQIEKRQNPNNKDQAAYNEGQKAIATAARVLGHRVSPYEDSLGQCTPAHSSKTCPPAKGSLTTSRLNQPISILG